MYVHCDTYDHYWHRTSLRWWTQHSVITPGLRQHSTACMSNLNRMQVAQHSLVRVVYQVSYFQLILYRVTSAAPLVASSPRLQRITFLHHNELAVITYNIQSIHRPEAYLSNFIHNYLLSTNTPLTIVWQIIIFDRELVATWLGVVVVVVDWWWWWCTCWGDAFKSGGNRDDF